MNIQNIDLPITVNGQFGTKHEPKPVFMTKVACEDEITMDDIRRVQYYRDNLILEMNHPKKDSETITVYNYNKTRLLNEIQIIHKWLKIMNQ